MAGLFGFLAAFSKKQMQGVGDSLTRAIVAWDPETATDAEIEEMISELDKITVEAGKAKADFEREQKRLTPYVKTMTATFPPQTCSKVR